MKLIQVLLFVVCLLAFAAGVIYTKSNQKVEISPVELQFGR